MHEYPPGIPANTTTTAPDRSSSGHELQGLPATHDEGPVGPSSDDAQRAALAALAFAESTTDSLSGSLDAGGGHLGWQPADALDLDLNDPEQRRLGDFELLSLIGRGGMAAVYRAFQISLQREVAIKLLGISPWAPVGFVEHFRREAQHAARMQHPNIVTIYGIGEQAEFYYYAMQLVDGKSLAELIETHPPSAREAARLVRILAEAVHYAHRLDVLHLDLKPGNVLINRDGEPLITDFGLARRLGHRTPEEQMRVAGTPSYMAPEQTTTKRLHEIGRCSDVYGLGAILYEMLTHHPPFTAATPHATLRLVRDGEVLPPRHFMPHLSLDLQAIVLKAMAREPADRYADAHALADDLARFLDARAVSSRPLSRFQRISRWARREPRFALIAGAVLLALFAALATTQIAWRQAQHKATSAIRINRFLRDEVLAGIGDANTPTTLAAGIVASEKKLDTEFANDADARAQIGLSLGRAYARIGLWQPAGVRLQSALAAARGQLGNDAQLTLSIETALAQASTETAHYDAAATLYAHLIPTLTTQYGWRDPATITVRAGDALRLFAMQHYEAASVALEAVRGDANTYAPGQLSDIEWALAICDAESNHWQDAERLMRETLLRTEQRVGSRHPHYLNQRLGLGWLMLMRQHWSEAESIFSDSHAGLALVLGDQHPATLIALTDLGTLELARGQPARALPILQDALSEQLRTEGSHSQPTQITMGRIGESLAALGRVSEAAEVLDHALSMATVSHRRQQAYALHIEGQLAVVQLALGDIDAADRSINEALRAADSSLSPRSFRRAELEMILAEVRVRQHRNEQARTAFQSARTVYASNFGEQDPRAKLAASHLLNPPPGKRH